MRTKRFFAIFESAPVIYDLDGKKLAAKKDYTVNETGGRFLGSFLVKCIQIT